MGNTINNEHDVGYKYLLSAKQVFVQLIRTFVKKGWIDQVDEANVKLINKSFVLPDFKEKEADIVYQMKLKGKEIIFYILTELQSTVDYQMPYRILLYMVEIWREYLKNREENEVKQKDFRLPVIVPMVLYNGKNNWTAPVEFKEMLNQADLFGDNVLNYKYILLDVNRYDEGNLLKISNLVSSIFYIDRETNNTEEMITRLFDLVGALNQLSNKEFDLFTAWFKRIVVRRFPENYQKEMERIIDEAKPREARRMISNLGESLQRHLAERLEEGMEKGKKEGEKEKALKVAKRLLLKGMSIDEVAEITELSREDIKKLENWN